MEATSVKNKQAQAAKHGLNLTALEEKSSSYGRND